MIPMCAISQEYVDQNCLFALDFTFLSLALDFLRLQLKIPSQVAYAEFIDAASIATVSALLQSSLSACHSFFGKIFVLGADRIDQKIP